MGTFAARMHGIPVAWFIRGWTGEDWKVRVYEALDRTLMPLASRIVCLSRVQANQLAHHWSLASKIRVVHNAIEARQVTVEERSRTRQKLRQALGLPDACTVAATAGRLSPEKGAAFFIRAIPAIREQFPGARYVLFGDGPLQGQIKEMAHQLGLLEEVRFAGHVPDFPQLLPGIDVLINPSLTEVMPNVVLEAMAASVPVVATAVGGVTEIAGDSTLLLIPPADSAALARAVTDLLHDLPRARKIGRAGQKRVQEAFSPTRQQAQLRGLYNELIPGLESMGPEAGLSSQVSGSGTTVLGAGTQHASPTSMSLLPFISVVIPVRNEEEHLGALIQGLLDQEYPANRYEIVVVDGNSTDGTTEIVKRYARHSSPRILLVPNPRQLSSVGRNVGVRASRGEIVVFIDGHCRIPNPKLFLETARILNGTGADCLCRPQPLTVSGNTFLQDVIAHARATVLGHGRDSTIYATDCEGFVNPTSSGASYRRSVFDRVGMYDEQFDACEDVEFNYRVFKSGFLSYLSPALAVYYRPRASLLGLFKQLARYGRGRLRFIRKHRNAVSASQLAPPGFLAWLAVGGLASLHSAFIREALLGTLAIYAAVVLGFSAVLGFRHGWRHFFVAPAVYSTIHFGLGAGFWAGLATCFLELFRGKKTPESAAPIQPTTGPVPQAGARGELSEFEKSHVRTARDGR
jgi:glycosyltransferase involved in cell wall biosynthesis